MASGRILMTPQELNDGAAFLRARLNAMESEVTSLKSKIDELTAA